jgi:nicotinamide mononucleotide transporter
LETIRLAEMAAAAFGLAAVGLAIRRSVLLWPSAMAMAAIYIAVFANSRLYSAMLLQCVLFVLQAYGWRRWSAGGGGAPPVTGLTGGQRAVCILAVAAGTCILGFLMGEYAGAAIPFPDAFAAVAGIIAQILLARGVWENWLMWAAADGVSCAVFYSQGLFFSSALYASFLALSVRGMAAWADEMRSR